MLIDRNIYLNHLLTFCLTNPISLFNTVVFLCICAYFYFPFLTSREFLRFMIYLWGTSKIDGWVFNKFWHWHMTFNCNLSQMLRNMIQNIRLKYYLNMRWKSHWKNIFVLFWLFDCFFPDDNLHSYAWN